ncbi:hypothetical protein HOY82DRAFT_229873 [Tuber indicum]|nr:hypothetical protein HOY82DRAFT_229873 [Tuber indicum]
MTTPEHSTTTSFVKMAETIFKQILCAIKSRTPELLTFDNVTPHDFADIVYNLRLRSNNLEQRSFRIHWFASDKQLKVVMPSKLHECAAVWLNEMIIKAVMGAIIPEIWAETMQISPSPEYKNFVGEYRGYTKEVDLTFIPLFDTDPPRKAEFPSVVLESGWDESAVALHRDARTWLVGSDGEVRVAIQVKFYRADQWNEIKASLWISRAQPGQRPTAPEEHIIFPRPHTPPPNPLVSLNEFYSGRCPPGVDPLACVSLDLERLRIIAGLEIVARGSVPAAP